MAFIDHTAPARLSVCNEPKDPTEQTDYPLSAEQQKRQADAIRLLGITLGMIAIQDLLQESRAAHRRTHGKRIALNGWPLPPEQCNNLRAALYFLKQYADTLRAEPSG